MYTSLMETELNSNSSCKQLMNTQKDSIQTESNCSHGQNSISSKEIIEPNKTSSTFVETLYLNQYRKVSFSHWDMPLKPTKQAMINAGWVYCNIKDRVLCFYCNVICEDWSRHDNPTEVHHLLAPHCPFISQVISEKVEQRKVQNFPHEKIEAKYPSLCEPTVRQKTFSEEHWKAPLPTVEELVRAGFFQSTSLKVVTCFYCGGSLHNWSENDKPAIEHVRWFPHCQYAKNLVGNEVYDIVRAKLRSSAATDSMSPGEIQNHVAARLDLPEIRNVIKKYSLKIVRRCLEDQLRLKNDDFKSIIDLSMACVVLMKQIEIIQGNKENIRRPPQFECSATLRVASFGECFVCLSEKRTLVFMPCGHLSTCVPCGYALKACPVCREPVQAFCRISF